MRAHLLGIISVLLDELELMSGTMGSTNHRDRHKGGFCSNDSIGARSDVRDVRKKLLASLHSTAARRN